MMFEALIKQNPHFGLPQDHVNFIKDLIRGRPRLTTGEKPFLFQIVANVENGLDVDKCAHSRPFLSNISRPAFLLPLSIGLIILLGMLIVVVSEFVARSFYISIRSRSEAWHHNITASVYHTLLKGGSEQLSIQVYQLVPGNWRSHMLSLQGQLQRLPGTIY